jgi:hypothetical protein
MVHDDWALACVRDGLAAMNRRDWSVFESLHAANVVYESPHAPRLIGRRAVQRRYEELVALVPDLHASELRMIDNNPVDRFATFEFVQTGTLGTTLDGTPRLRRGVGSPFLVRTTMFVRFDGDGRVASLRTGHN